MELTFKHKLDTYYLTTIVYGVTFVIYVAVTGTLIDNRFELVWKDPIVYLLGICVVVSFIALCIMAMLSRKVLIRDHELVFRTRFKERVIKAEDIEWIGLRRDGRVKLRTGNPYPAAKIKLRKRRRLLWLRPSSFERSKGLTKKLIEWMEMNGVELRRGRRPKKMS